METLSTYYMTYIAICLVGYCLYSAGQWWGDLKFYRANKWDFTKDSGRKIFAGTARRDGIEEIPISNRRRVFVAYPLLILTTAILAILLLVIELGKQI